MEEEIIEKLRKIYKNIGIEVEYEEVRNYNIIITIEINSKIVKKEIKHIWNGYISINENIFEIECNIDDIIISLYKKGESKYE